VEQESVTRAFDFDWWAELARTDPQAFERERTAVIGALIAGVPAADRRRVVGLQWRIDEERGLASSPFAACLGLYSRMWDAVLDDTGLLAQLRRFQPTPAPKAHRGPDAVVLSFQRKPPRT
jgi:hypothetical protein